MCLARQNLLKKSDTFRKLIQIYLLFVNFSRYYLHCNLVLWKKVSFADQCTVDELFAFFFEYLNHPSRDLSYTSMGHIGKHFYGTYTPFQREWESSHIALNFYRSYRKNISIIIWSNMFWEHGRNYITWAGMKAIYILWSRNLVYMNYVKLVGYKVVKHVFGSMHDIM
jgi:hypothetical protein